jgi:hypothetical protein
VGRSRRQRAPRLALVVCYTHLCNGPSLVSYGHSWPFPRKRS